MREHALLRKKKGQAFAAMVVSYIAILCVPILASLFLYMYAYRIVENQSQIYSSNMIETVKKTCDYEMDAFNNFLRQLKMEKSIQKLDDAKPDYWNEAQVKAQLESEWNYLLEKGTSCETVFIYMKKQDKILSQLSSMDVSYFAERFGIDETFLREIFENAGRKTGNSAGLKKGEQEYILLTEPVINGAKSSGETIVGALIRTDELKEQISSFEWNGEMDWMILNEDGQLLRCPENFSLDRIALEKDEKKMTADGKDYLIVQNSSKIYQWTYVLLTPEKVINNSVSKLRFATMIGLIITMISGCVLALYMSGRQYRPLQKLLDNFSDMESGENEYEYIEKQIVQIKENAKSIEQKERKNRRKLRVHALQKLLETSEPQAASQEEELLYSKFQKGSNAVLLCYCEEKDTEEELNNYILSNVFEEGIGEYFTGETLLYNHVAVSILNFPEKPENSLEALEMISRKLQKFLTEHFHLKTYTIEGEAYEGIEGIHKSWIEAYYALSFIGKMEDTYIRSSEIKEYSICDYTYTIQLEERVINAIRSGNELLAQMLIGQVLKEGFGMENRRSPEVRTCILYDILGTLLKLSEEQGVHVGKMPRLNQITADTPIDELQSYFQEIVGDICKEFLKQEERKNETGLGAKILEYVKENYADPDLNISQIAQSFGMSPSWISSSFKAQMGESLLNTIKRIRMEHAVELLEKDYNVAEVSGMVGFRENTSFIRTFKGYYGKTPGQIKKREKLEN